MKAAWKRHKIVIILTAVLLFFVGSSYGAWTDMLHIRGKVTTSSFGIEFGNVKDIRVGLVKRDSSNKINYLNKNIEFNATENGNKEISLTIKLDMELMDSLSVSGHMLCVEYPIKTSEQSKVKAINSEKADFNKPYTVIKAIPDYAEIVIYDESFPINEEINKNDYGIDFNVYRQIVTDDNIETTASVFIEVKNIDRYGNIKLGSIDYSSLKNIEGCDIAFENPIVNAQLKAEYSLKISIPTEQFNIANNDETVHGE
jgi:hypothetical protein